MDFHKVNQLLPYNSTLSPRNCVHILQSCFAKINAKTKNLFVQLCLGWMEGARPLTVETHMCLHLSILVLVKY